MRSACFLFQNLLIIEVPNLQHRVSLCGWELLHVEDSKFATSNACVTCQLTIPIRLYFEIRIDLLWLGGGGWWKQNFIMIHHLVSTGKGWEYY